MCWAPADQRERYAKIMRRHIRQDDDHPLTDDAFVRKVMARYEAERGVPLVDPNE